MDGITSAAPRAPLAAVKCGVIRSSEARKIDLRLFAFERGLAEALTEWRSGYGSFWCQRRRGFPRKMRLACDALAENYRAFCDAVCDIQTGRICGGPPVAWPPLSEAHFKLSAAELGFLGALGDWLSRFLRFSLDDGDAEVPVGVEFGILLGFLDAAFDAALAGADEPRNSPLRQACGLFSECCVGGSWTDLLKLTELTARNRFFGSTDHEDRASELSLAAVETLSSVFGSLAAGRRVAVWRLRHAEAR
jgi:hypothetical protein